MGRDNPPVVVTRRRKGKGPVGRADLPDKVLRALLDRKLKSSNMRARSDKTFNKAKPTETIVTNVLMRGKMTDGGGGMVNGQSGTGGSYSSSPEDETKKKRKTA